MSTSWEYQPNPVKDAGEGCVFCKIIAGQIPSKVVYQDDEIIVIHNQLRWVPVMLLVMPKAHLSQQEMWQGAIMAKIAGVAVEIGKTHCPDGFRILSNFGHQAMQSQTHGHLHVLGGAPMGRYV